MKAGILILIRPRESLGLNKTQGSAGLWKQKRDSPNQKCASGERRKTNVKVSPLACFGLCLPNRDHFKRS